MRKLYFRAYAVDILKEVEEPHEYGILPNARSYDRYKDRAPAASWTVALSETPDLKEKQTVVTPPVAKNGLYYVVASATPDFRVAEQAILGAPLVVSDFVMMSRTEAGFLKATVVRGDFNEPVPGAKIKLYRFQYGKRAELKSEATTDKTGEARFAAKSNDYASYFLVGEKDSQGFIDPAQQYLQPEQAASSRRASFIYTDRSIFRPNQKVQWKVVAYQGKAGKADFAVTPNQDVTMTLLDANYQEVQRVKVKTNAFGSAAGEFLIPAGRLLGSWQIRSSAGGNSQAIKVEEYKRPTYEVSFKDPPEPLRLNRQAKLKGEAKYYFGLPVTAGRVEWRVTREPVYAWWWSYYAPPNSSKAQVIATGSAKLDEQGSFKVSFLPSAEEKTGKEAQGLSFRYVATADLTDEGGETRSATRSFRLGYVAVEASIDAEKQFLTAGEQGAFTVTRASLDGVPRPGDGTYRVVELKQPEQPAEPPLAPAAGFSRRAGALQLGGWRGEGQRRAEARRRR
jgi:uncharacterized protein YfaS (alpha-2-macroglobulin family)